MIAHRNHRYPTRRTAAAIGINMRNTIHPLLALFLMAACGTSGKAEFSGPLQRYHAVTVDFKGPHTREDAEPNPFRDFRLEVTFAHAATGKEYTVPGYFAADGNAAETGATEGSVWRAHFVPEETGAWTYLASFRRGKDIAMDLDPEAGVPYSFDGARGTLEVAETDKEGRDFRARGMLRYVGARYLRFDSGEYFVKGGSDSPENLLAYVDFDGTYSLREAGIQRSGEAPTASLHAYAPHAADWHANDPSWRGDKGKNLIGAMNYLAGTGVNAISFLTLNIEGDGQDVWPFTSHDTRDRYDVSKLAQWEIIFSHADSLGLFLHFKTQETENDLLLDGGELGAQRKLYYRELVARFAHHHALNWNLGEENDIWEELDDPRQERIRSYIAYVHALDAYDHPVVIHSYPQQKESVYGPLLGPGTALDGASLQTHPDAVHNETLYWIRASERAGHAWVVANDEQGPHTIGVMPDGPGSNRALIRQRVLWGNLMAGGAGVEYYFGYENPHNDLNLEDFRSRAEAWSDVAAALTFFREQLPFNEMHAADSLARGPSPAYVLAHTSQALICIYLPQGGSMRVELPAHDTEWHGTWFNPRTGLALDSGAFTVSGAAPAVGPAPHPGDALVILRLGAQ